MEWKNLIPRHDGGRSATVEEYLRKKFRYQMTPYAVEIERMVEGLEKIRGYGGSLEPSLLETIAQGLQMLMGKAGNFQEGEAAAMWRNIYNTFRQLSEEAADYIASLQSSKAEELMMSVNFLAYKSSLTIKLQNFVSGLQVNGMKVEGLLQLAHANCQSSFLESVLADWGSTPKLDVDPDPEGDRNRLVREWQNLMRWFLGDETSDSDLQFLERATKDTIAKIVRCALRIQEKQRSGVSRRRELEYLGDWFLGLKEVEEAHYLAAHTFGLYRARYFQGIDAKGTDSVDVSMWERGPNLRTLTSRSRTRRRETSSQAMTSHRDEQAQAREQYLQRCQEEEAMLLDFVKQGKVRISELGLITPPLRLQLLAWIGKCMGNRTKVMRTVEGIEIALSDPPLGQRATLQCTDGELDMPDYILVFRDGLVERSKAGEQ